MFEQKKPISGRVLNSSVGRTRTCAFRIISQNYRNGVSEKFVFGIFSLKSKQFSEQNESPIHRAKHAEFIIQDSYSKKIFGRSQVLFSQYLIFLLAIISQKSLIALIC